MITKQGLEQSLLVAVEFGFKCREKNMNLQATMEEATAIMHDMAEKSDLPNELLRISSRVVRCTVCKRKPCACTTNAVAKVSRRKV